MWEDWQWENHQGLDGHETLLVESLAQNMINYVRKYLVKIFFSKYDSQRAFLLRNSICQAWNFAAYATDGIL